MQPQAVFHIITMSTYGIGLSGGDRIWIELSKQIGRKYRTYIYLWEEGQAIAKREGLKEAKYVVWSAKQWARFGFVVNYFARIIIGILNAFRLNLRNSPPTIVYSASEFWQDSLPVFILKLRYPKIRWVAAWYQTAPNPFADYSFRTCLYWFMQFPVKSLIKKFADLVIVNNDNEKKQFPQMGEKNKVFVMLGAVDITGIRRWRRNHRFPKVYDACFQGRFHPQKGVLELIDIWRMVVDKKPDAKLVMIGDGPLWEDVKLKIKNKKLETNIKLLGWVFDGPKKYEAFAQSKMVVHPAVYDSGGMASQEAMAFGLPCVGFNLPSYESYYPKGMFKCKLGNLEEFASQILQLLNNPKLRNELGTDGLMMLEENWSWKVRAESLLHFLKIE